MQQLIQLYDQFLKLFPDSWHPLVSIAILIAMVIIIIRFWKTEVIGIILLVIFIPASIPVLRSIGMGLVQFAQHVVGH